LALFALLTSGIVVASTRPALAQSLAPVEGPSNVGSEPAPEVAPRGLITIESDTQSADNVTGVVTAAGNVRIVYPLRGMVATARQAQYFSQEGRLVLTGDVDIVQEGGNALRAERVVYLLEQERAEAEPISGQQVFSQMVIQSGRPMPTPLTP
jgi:lipopolysaccharide export system protein LptA